MQLNSQQQQIIEHSGKPLCVFAGPGTGKTKVLEMKMKHLIANEGISPNNIIGLTFTNTAATELTNRVQSMLNTRKESLRIGTFHSQCLKIITTYPEECGLKKGFDILTPQQQEKRIAEIIKELSFSWNTNYLPAIRESLSKAKRQQKWINDNTYPQGIAKEIYNLYEYYLKTSNELDFDDMIIKVNKMFESHPELLEEYRKTFLHILVDEAQDMDSSQYLFLTNIKADNTIIVGDDDQSIYEFTGASMKYMHRFVEDWNADTIVLTQNYRNTKTILKASSEQIKYNNNRKDKNLTTKNIQGNKIKILNSPNETEEAKNIINLIKDKPDPAILYRQNIQSEPFEAYLQKEQIPYTIINGRNLHSRSEIKDAIAILTLTFKDDPIAFKRMLMTQSGIGPKTINLLMDHARQKNIKLIETLPLTLDGISEEQHNTLQHVYNKMVHHTSKEHLINSLLLYYDEKKTKNLEEFTQQVKNYKGTIKELIEEIKHLENNPKTIKLLTLHKSKGLEFETVAISGYEEGLIPHENTIYETNTSSTEEERRLSYVAITRSKNEVILSYAHERNTSGITLSQLPSSFLKEIPMNYMEYI